MTTNASMMPRNNKAVCFTLWFHVGNNIRYTDLLPRLVSVLRVHKVPLSRHWLLRGMQYRLWHALSRKLIYPGVLRYLSRRYTTLWTADYKQIPAWPRNESVVVDVDDPVFSASEVQYLNLPQVKAIIVTTEKAKKVFENLGVRRTIRVIPQGVSVEQADSNKRDEIRRLMKGDRDVVVGYPAPTLTLASDGEKRAREGQDDLDFLFASVDKARELEPRLKLWLFGRPSESVRKYAEERAAWIRVFGYVPFPEILHYIASFDIGVYPRTWAPPQGRFSLKLAQFIALGIPVVSTDLDESAIVKEARSGIVCKSQQEFSQALVELARSSVRRGELAIAGRSYAQTNLDWSVLVPKYKDILMS